MKRDGYQQLFEEAVSADLRGLGKLELKNAMDDWIQRGLAIANKSGESFSDWERIHFRDAINSTYDGLFFLGRANLVKAVMPDHPNIDWPMAPDGDLAELSLGVLTEAADWLSRQSAQEHPIFMRPNKTAESAS